MFCTHDPSTIAHGDVPGADDRVTGLVADVRSPQDMQRVVATARSRYGGVDGLVCSAGIQTYGTVEDTSVPDWHRVLDVNLTGVFLAAKYAMPELRERGGGAIVAVSSIQGRTPNPRVLGYSTSKAAVDGLVRSMAVDSAKDRIRVNAVAPGPVNTPLLKTVDPAQPAPRPTTAPVTGPPPRLAEPAEIAELIAFLLSDRAAYITGTTVYADGGMSAGSGSVLITA